MTQTELPVTKTCLNGWWDILPCYGAVDSMSVPDRGWLEKQYLVPSFWTKPTSAVRRAGEPYYTSTDDPSILDEGNVEFLFDAFGYPSEWSKTRSAWVRRSLSLAEVRPDVRYHLVFGALMPKARLVVNGHEACTHIQPALPMEADVTPWLRAGENEIVVLIEDYDRDDRGRALVPTGNTIPCDHSGIWQDVWLVQRADVSVSDVTIRTSTRAQTLTVLFEVTNASDRARHVRLASDVRDWSRDGDPDTAPALTLPVLALDVDPGAKVSVETTVPWVDATWWYPEAPKLYQLRTVVLEAESALEISYERFGFREVWIDGPDILLNGYPMHLFSDWGHKWTPYYYTEGWIRKWFGMIHDAQMNHSRLHTHPHPPITLDLADEEGILITAETGLHGSGGEQGAASPAYWEAAADHVRRFVRRDKNHPSIVLWSVENEMRWNTKQDSSPGEVEMTQARLPGLRALFNELDPTRPAYHEGDTSLWNERTQPIISRHYGKECAGIGWWDRSQPLHSGEMALYHYAGPNTTLHLGGDAVYADFDVIDTCAAQDAAWIIETGRTLGVSCFGPWNLSCLENLRATPKDVSLDYEDPQAPGVKPLRVPANSSEFDFWQTGAGYTPNASFAVQAQAFRPLAVIDRSLRSGYFAGQAFRRELFIANDTPHAVTGQLVVALHLADRVVHEATYPLTLGRGHIASIVFQIEIPPDLPADVYVYRARFEAEGEVLDAWERTIKVETSAADCGDEPIVSELTTTRIAVFGPGTLRSLLASLRCDYVYVDDLDPPTLAGAKILIMEKNTVVPGSAQNRQVQVFVRNGGRLILMEQSTSLFPGLALVDKPVLKAFIRAYGHPALGHLTDGDLFAWGEDPYPLLASDAYVAMRMYRKDDGGLMLPLLDSGEGGFGTGDLDTTPLFESPDGSGLILACQMRLTDKLVTIPAAEALLVNLLNRAATYQPTTTASLVTVSGGQTDGLTAYSDAARQGATVIVENATPAGLSAWSEALGMSLVPADVGEVYQVVRSTDHPLLSGVSNEDTCGIETFSYSPPTARDFVVGNTFLAPTSEVEALLQTPTSSCLRELVVCKGQTEALRAHTLALCLRGDKHEPAVALGLVEVGRGRILFDQFAPDREPRERFARLRNRLLANLGRHKTGSLLDGECVPSARPTSAGYPQAVYVCNGPVDDALRREMLECCEPTLERMVATPVLALGKWQLVASQDGVWRAGDYNLSGDIYLYHTIWSPSPRKNVATNLGVPNPEALTFLDLEGSGIVQVAVNGRTFEPVTVNASGATVSDISLEMGGNHMLARWTPGAPDAVLKMRWRNIMRQPETGLQFGSAGSSD